MSINGLTMYKENKKLAYLAAAFMHSPYCEVCPVSEGGELDFIKDDMECWLRFFEWYERTANNGQEYPDIQ